VHAVLPHGLARFGLALVVLLAAAGQVLQAAGKTTFTAAAALVLFPLRQVRGSVIALSSFAHFLAGALARGVPAGRRLLASLVVVLALECVSHTVQTRTEAAALIVPVVVMPAMVVLQLAHGLKHVIKSPVQLAKGPFIAIL